MLDWKWAEMQTNWQLKNILKNSTTSRSVSGNHKKTMTQLTKESKYMKWSEQRVICSSARSNNWADSHDQWHLTAQLLGAGGHKRCMTSHNLNMFNAHETWLMIRVCLFCKNSQRLQVLRLFYRRQKFSTNRGLRSRMKGGEVQTLLIVFGTCT